MKSYADTGFLVSLYLNEATTTAANAAVQTVRQPLPLIPLGLLELRNALYLAVFRKQISEATRAAAWQRVEIDIKNGIYVEAPIGQLDLHEKAAQLAQKYTAIFGTRTLDLLHIAAAILLGASQLLSFDERQRRTAKREGLKLRPA
ncbi:MAG: type II toxin-antitoxin system VapC family toxin [Verrucomicrobia bacterium]|jgi:predicted nucleic acid-binding protein|nr:type II toxin-antitoxin system VapC family toxin [Verrucomicrobiota bacterium]